MATWTKYESWKENSGDGTQTYDYDTDTIKAMIVSNAYTPNVGSHTAKSDITGEVSGTEYTAGGETMAITTAKASGVATYNAAAINYAQSGTGFSTGRYIIFYKDTGVASTSPLLGYYDAVSSFGNVAAALAISFPTGFFTDQ